MKQNKQKILAKLLTLLLAGFAGFQVVINTDSSSSSSSFSLPFGSSSENLS